MLDGFGPIPPSMARKLITDGADSYHRVLVDPRDGAPLEIGRTSYRVTKAMRNWLRMRDGKCPFPGCNNHSLDNEADHILAWHKGGTTGISNLGQPCPKHHRLRHTTGWTPTPATKDRSPGWTSPTGRHYKSEHQDWEPPHWPEQLDQKPKPGLATLRHRQRSAPRDASWDTRTSSIPACHREKTDSSGTSMPVLSPLPGRQPMLIPSSGPYDLKCDQPSPDGDKISGHHLHLWLRLSSATNHCPRVRPEGTATLRFPYPWCGSQRAQAAPSGLQPGAGACRFPAARGSPTG